MAKCPKCLEKKGKRYCPALASEICTRCCGEHRLRTIQCPKNCEYLAGESYQSERRQEKSRMGGKKFLQQMSGLFSQRGLFNFAIMLHADIYAYSRVHGPLNNTKILKAFEDLKGLLSPIFVPSGEQGFLAGYLQNRLEKSQRYENPPGFGAKDRLRVLEKLIQHVGSLSAGDSTSYLDDMTQAFGPVDLTRDFGFSDEDFSLLRGENGGRGFQRSQGGLILPG